LHSYVALLRGINVGGKNLLPMKDLTGLFAEAGCAGVRTYIQSGNVLFQASPARAERLPSLIAQGIADRFGYRTAVLLRSVEELGETIRNNPFPAAGAAESWLHVMFLASRPDALRVAALDPDRSPPDTFVVRGREIYLQCPNGVGNSKLTNAWFDAQLATTGTGRNWRTVRKLFDLAGAATIVP
jgi:uncharacterized protein (DUF1697 family)